MKRLTRNQIFWPSTALVVLLVFNAVFTKNFFNVSVVDGHFYGNIIDILKNFAPLALLSTGMTLVVATGGVDISVGSVVAISGAVACSIIDGRLGVFDYDLAAALALALLSGVLCGLWNGFLVAKVKIQPMVATLILMTAGRGIAQLITNGKIVTVNSAPMMEPYYFIGAGYLLGLPFALYIVLAVSAAIMLLVRRTAFGLFLESLGVNSRSSRLSGVNVDRMKLTVFTISGLLAGIAGILISSNIKGADCNNAGLFIELDAILSVAIGGNSLGGGRFMVPASLVGALFVQCLTTTVYALGVPPEVISLIKALVIVVLCLFQSREFRKRIFGGAKTSGRSENGKEGVKAA